MNEEDDDPVMAVTLYASDGTISDTLEMPLSEIQQCRLAVFTCGPYATVLDIPTQLH